ncbi:MAG: hypothetical protein J1E34_09135 [Oscillospiraceae bacterium]|nr:hypothetical protein [Oscillospiraceae bacterium]
MFGKVKKLVCAFLALLFLLLCSCASFEKSSVSSFVFSSNIIGTSSVSAPLHISNAENLSSVCRSGFYELYFERENGSVSIRDISSDKYWNSIPVFKNTSSAVISASLASRGGRCYLNSQDNSIAFSSYNVDFTDNGLKITYYMSDNAETVKKSFSSLREGEIYLVVPVCFELIDGNLKVSINSGEIIVSPGFVLEKLSVLPYFGALSGYSSAKLSEEAENPAEEEPEDESENEESDPEIAEETPERDFLLVPDGCGAVMYTDTDDENTSNLSFEVCGGNGAGVGCFGIKSEKSSFVGIIDEGSEIASIRAMRPSANSDGVFAVYPEFSVTPVSISGESYYYAESYKGEISLTYKFLSGELCSYMDMASACREELIRGGKLSSSALQSGVYPLNLSVIGSVDGSGKNACTEFEQVEDLLGVLKAKGVDSINLILDGFFEDGIYQNDASSVSFLSALGGKKAMKALSSYALTQSIDIYAGLNILYTSSKLNAALSLSGDRLSVTVKNPLSPYIGGEGKKMYLLSADKIEKSVISAMNGLKSFGITGYALGSEPKSVYPDYKSEVSVSDFSSLLKEHYASFAAQKKLLLRGANFCVIKDAEVLTDVPLYASYPESSAYEAVPFIPAMLHSTLVYSGLPANAGEIYTLELLKSVEYGASPYVRWIYDSRSPLFYELNFSEISEFYANALKKLGDLSSHRMTGHRKIEDGLYETSYSGGSIVYVNYNNYSVNVGSISVPPYDYLRIN